MNIDCSVLIKKFPEICVCASPEEKKESPTLDQRVSGIDLGNTAKIVRDVLQNAGYIETFSPIFRQYDSAVNPRFSITRMDGRESYLRDCMELPLREYISSENPKVFEIGPCFRQGENDSTHSEEFYMMELYSLNESLDDMIKLTINIVEATLDRSVKTETISVKGVIQEEFNLDISTASTELLNQAIINKYPDLSADAKYKVVNNYIELKGCELFVEKDILYFLCEYPLCTIDSAKRVGNENCILRFEAHYNGLEIAHAFVDCMDSSDLETRNEETLDNESIELISLIQNGKLYPTVGLGIGINRLTLLKEM